MVHPTLEKPEDFNINKLYMWRCVVAMAHEDGIIHEDEKKYLSALFVNMGSRVGMPEEHIKTLEDDLNTPQDIAGLLPHLDEPKYRSQVVYFARLLAYKDDELHPSEELLLAKLHAEAIDTIDLEAIKKEVAYNVQSDLVIHEVNMDSQRPTSGIYGLIDQITCHFGIDLMDD